ncbi:MAG: lytic transglycosylase domain-containing protein [Planctomycetota bacterium]
MSAAKPGTGKRGKKGRAQKPRGKKAGGRGGRLLSRPVLAGGAALVALGLAGFVAGRGLGRAPGHAPYRREIARWCAEYRVNPDLAAAVVEVESSGRPRAVSSAGALGLMQLMPRTAAAMAKELGLPPPSREGLFGPELNIRLGVYYLAKQRRRFCDERVFVIAAYHAGPTRVDRWRRRRADLSAAKVIEESASSATRHYARKVLARWREIAGAKRGP